MKSGNNYQINAERILLSQIADEGVVYDIETNDYKILSVTMLKILTGLQIGQSPVEICDELVAEYDIEPEICLKKVQDAISILLEKHYILSSV